MDNVCWLVMLLLSIAASYSLAQWQGYYAGMALFWLLLWVMVLDIRHSAQRAEGAPAPEEHPTTGATQTP